ncbi:MAG TPA: class I SAM-dependent methyltransferase [Candidatus Paceibacterota bacterium]
MNQTQLSRFDGLVNGYSLFTGAIVSYPRLQEQVRLEVERGTARWPWQRTLKCLEIGPGPGATTKSILEADKGIHIVAVEPDADMVAKLQDNLTEWQCADRVEIVPTDILAYFATVPDNTFHFVATAFALHNIESGKRDAIIREIYRVLVPGGKFVNGDKYARDNAEEHALAYQRQMTDFVVFEAEHHTGDLKKWEEHYERDEQSDLLFKETPAKEFMREIGFTKVLTVYRENLEAVIVGQKQ